MLCRLGIGSVYGLCLYHTWGEGLVSPVVLTEGQQWGGGDTSVLYRLHHPILPVHSVSRGEELPWLCVSEGVRVCVCGCGCACVYGVGVHACGQVFILCT